MQKYQQCITSRLIIHEIFSVIYVCQREWLVESYILVHAACMVTGTCIYKEGFCKIGIQKEDLPNVFNSPVISISK